MATAGAGALQAIPERDFRVEASIVFPELEAAVARKQVDFVPTNPWAFSVLISHQQNCPPLLATLVNDVNGTPSASFGSGWCSRYAGAGWIRPSACMAKTVALPARCRRAAIRWWRWPW